MNEKTCNNCKWWDIESATTIYSCEVRNCVRRCPVRLNADLDLLRQNPTAIDNSSRLALWPKTSAEQYCGDFEPKEEDKI